MFVRGHAVIFLCLLDLVNNNATKATTPNCVLFRDYGYGTGFSSFRERYHVYIMRIYVDWGGTCVKVEL